MPGSKWQVKILFTTMGAKENTKDTIQFQMQILLCPLCVLCGEMDLLRPSLIDFNLLGIFYQSI